MAKKKQNETQPQPTNPSEWRKHREEGVLLKLPSGKWGRFRAVDFAMVVRLGKLPDTLTGLVIEAFKGGNQKLDIETMEDVQQYVDLLDAVTKCVFVYPKVVDDPQKEDEISVEDVEEQDKAWLLWLLGKSAADLESFREEQNTVLESLRDSDGNGETTQPDREFESVGDAELSAG